MKFINLILIGLIAVVFSACASKMSKPEVTERDGVSAISNTPNLETTFIKSNGHPERFCAARASDVADTSSSDANIGGGAMGDNGDIGEGSSQGSVTLGGRNPAVLIVREMMYRVCELSMNLNTDTNQTIEIYFKMIDAMKDIVATQTGAGTKSMDAASTPVALPNAPVSTAKDTTTSTTDSSDNDSNSNSDNSNDSDDY